MTTLTPDAFDSFVCGSHSTLLKRATALLVFSTLIVELIGGPEHAGGRNSDIVHPEIYTEDCSGLGIGFRVVGFDLPQ